MRTITKEQFLKATGLTIHDDIYVMSTVIRDKCRYTVLLAKDGGLRNITCYVARFMNYRRDKNGMMITSNSSFMLIYDLTRMLQFDIDLPQWVNKHLRYL